MPTTLTLKNIPDEVYDRLRQSAEAHRRSLNSEAIVCLEAVLMPARISPEDRLARARELRARLAPVRARARDVDAFKRQGAPVIVVDSNVIAYLYLPGEHTAGAEKLLAAGSPWAAPVLWRSEFRNILAGYLRRKSITFEQACDVQREAEGLLAGYEFDVDSPSVLNLVRASDCSAYDCEFVALAMHLETKLVTMDHKLLRAFPDRTVALAAV